MKGIVFAIEEFAVHDGPGLRVNVFMKGCPLRCKWCHNPEGLNPRPQILRNPNACDNCGKCGTVCPSPDKCILCASCVYNCPRDALRVSGSVWEAADLARKIMRYNHIFKNSGGGVTVSGGEPLMQAGFVTELLSLLPAVHRIVETSGFGNPVQFREMLKVTDCVYFDIKVVDREKHVEFTGQPNNVILANLDILKESGVRFVIRIPFIAGVNDGAENIKATARLIEGAKCLECVELLPYNEFTGGKYPLLGMEYGETFTKPEAAAFNWAREIFSTHGIRMV